MAKEITKKEIEQFLPPQNIEAEESVLGALMIDPGAIYKVADFLLSKDFYKTHHQKIYETMLELFEKREPIDFLTLSSRLKDKNILEEVGGLSYLSLLVNKVPTATNIVHYAKIVRDRRTLRDLLTAANDISELARKEEQNIDDVLDEAEQKIFQISQRFIQERFRHLRDDLTMAFERIDQLHKGGHTALRGVPTGFKSLDNWLSGLQKSDLVILAARPSLGKTSLALDIARNTAVKYRVPIGIFSLEMSRAQIVDRLIAAEATVGLWKIRTGKLAEEGEFNDFAALEESFSRLSEAPIYIDDYPSPTMLQIRTAARRLQAEFGLGLLVIDYLQLIRPRENYQSMVQQVSEISHSLKALARELDIPVLAVSQLSRAVEHRPSQRPRLSDLRESGSIEQDADVVCMIYRDDRYNPESEKKNVAEIIIAKHRNGPIGEVELYFDQEIVSFRDIETHLEQPDLTEFA